MPKTIRSERTRAEILDACLAVWFDFVPKIYPVARDLIRLRSEDEEAARAWNDRMGELLQLLKSLVRSLFDRAKAVGQNIKQKFQPPGCYA